MSNVLIANGLKRGGNSRLLESEEYSAIAFDSVASIAFNFSSQITSHPVDSKSNITDHVFQNNDQFTLKATISNSPVVKYDNNVVGYQEQGVKYRAEKALVELQSLKETGSVVSLATSWGLITPCLIANISGTITAETANAYEFSITLQKINQVDFQRATLVTQRNRSETIADETASKSSQGGKDKKEWSDLFSSTSRVLENFVDVSGVTGLTEE